MPTYEVKLQDGSVYRIDAPNDDALRAAVDKLNRKQSAGVAAGQMARAAVTGLGALPPLVADLPGAAVNAIAGREVVEPWMASKMFQRGLDELGFPEGGASLPELLASGLGGTSGAIGLGTNLARSSGGIASRLGSMLAEAPGTQAVGTTAGTLAAQGVAAAGGGPVAQTAASVVGGGTAGATQNIAGRSRAVVDPLLASGQRRAVGDALRRMAVDPDAAQVRLASAREIVPGSKPTTAQAAQDYGIAAAESPVFETSGQRGLLSQRLSEQNSARQRLLDRVGVSDETVALLEGKAEKVAGPLREKAFSDASKPTLRNSVAYLKGLQGSEKAVNPSIQQALEFAGEQLARAAGKAGEKLDVRRLYEARKVIADAARGKYDGESRQMRLAKGELEGLLRSIDRDIEQAAPGYRAYMDRYAKVAQATDSVRDAAAIRAKATTASPEIQAQDPTAQYGRFLSQPAMARAVSAAARDKNVSLLPRQQRAIELVLRDLDRAASTNNAAGRAQGSNTARNLTMSYVLGKVMTDSLADNATARAVAKPLQAVYGLAGSEQEMSRLLAEAMLDPKIAAELLADANMRNAERLANSLAAVARRGATGGTTGTLATQQ